jgi:hypothetical protein
MVKPWAKIAILKYIRASVCVTLQSQLRQPEEFIDGLICRELLSLKNLFAEQVDLLAIERLLDEVYGEGNLLFPSPSAELLRP